MSEAWEFFSSPKNLSKITPEHMQFQILYISGGDKAYAGQIIRYNVSVLPGIKVHWVTEITQVKEPFHFIDEQRFGPYAMWHHQHHFKEVAGGVEMLAHWIFVGGEVNRIFNHRYKVLEEYFSKSKTGFLKTA